MEDKFKRKQALIRLLQTKNLHSQDEVVQSLNELGFDVTQSSVSRDFRELDVIKVRGCYRIGSSFSGDNTEKLGIFEGIRRFIRKAQPVGDNLLVVRTDPGAAQVVASVIDDGEMSGVVGTVAGDDTVFVATMSKEVQEVLCGILA